MINLLPKDLKRQYKYSRYNTSLRGYVLLAIGVGVLLSVLTVFGNIYISSQRETIEADLAKKNTEIAAFNEVEEEAKALDDKISATLKALESTTRYSAIVREIGTLLPAGTRITQLTLDGSIESPLSLVVEGASEPAVLSAPASFTESDRFSHADIVSFRTLPDGTFSLEVNLAFPDASAATSDDVVVPQGDAE